MEWLHLVSYFLGGAFLTNAVPHFVAGVMENRFRVRLRNRRARVVLIDHERALGISQSGRQLRAHLPRG